MRSADQFNTADRLIAAGLNDCAISRADRRATNDRSGLAAATGDPIGCLGCALRHCP
jgi:hypothetical protein